MFIIYTRTSSLSTPPSASSLQSPIADYPLSLCCPLCALTDASGPAAPLHAVFGGTYLLSPLYWLIPVAFGCVLLAWSTARVYITRRALSASSVKPVEGLQMCTSTPALSLGITLTSAALQSRPSSRSTLSATAPSRARRPRRARSRRRSSLSSSSLVSRGGHVVWVLFDWEK